MNCKANEIPIVFGLSSNSPDKSRVTGLLGNVLEVTGHTRLLPCPKTIPHKRVPGHMEAWIFVVDIPIVLSNTVSKIDYKQNVSGNCFSLMWSVEL